ncbi:MAG: glycosyltransferase [Magnetococcales bacterium]|nr:glycosyltransferase [Magnetococcales bacterium]
MAGEATAGARPLRVIVVSAVIDPDLGGPATVVGQHLRALRRAGVEATLFGVADAARLPVLRGLYPDAHLFPFAFPRRWFRGAGLVSALMEAVPTCDLIHAHMLWDHAVWAAWRAASQLQKPFVVTPHGSLMELWRYRSWHKRLYRRLLVDPMLARTACVHVLTPHEAAACGEAGVRAPLRVAPNFVEEETLAIGAPENRFGLAQRAASRWPELAGAKVLLYLGRLWEGKGVMDLLDAWANLTGQSRTDGWRLVLAGPDYKGCRARVERRMRELNVTDRVILAGPVQGEEKAALLALASGFVQPSHSEGFSMALLEAMAAGLPSVFTRECHFPELAQAGGGIEVPMGEEGIMRGLGRLLAMSSQERSDMGGAARVLALGRFSMNGVAHELLSLYRELLE